MEFEAKKNPLKEEALAGNPSEGISSLTPRLERYAVAKKRSSGMAYYIKTNHPAQRKVQSRLNHCGSWLVFRHYFKSDTVRLANADFCKQHLICPFCAIRRGAKYVQAYSHKVETVLEQDSINFPQTPLKPYMVTLTVKNDESLTERYAHLTNAMKRMIQKRRDYISNPLKRVPVEMNKAIGGVYSNEFKRGKDSGLWHPHSHQIWLCRTPPNQAKLSEEWQAITGDSFIVDVRPLENNDSRLSGFLEVFKYALKFSTMSFKDNWDGYQALTTKRMVGSFGNLRGVPEPENLADEQLDEPYLELFYNYFKGNYTLMKHLRVQEGGLGETPRIEPVARKTYNAKLQDAIDSRRNDLTDPLDIHSRPNKPLSPSG